MTATSADHSQLRSTAVRWAGVVTAGCGIVLVVVFITIDPSVNGWMCAFFGYLLTGGLLLWQLPTNRIGWWLVAVGLFFPLGGMVDSPSLDGIPAGVEAILQPLSLMGFLALIVVVTIFPDGTATSRGQRIVLWVVGSLALIASLTSVTYSDVLNSGRPNPLALSPLEGIDRWLYDNGFICVPILLVCAFFDMARRWRQSTGVRRQQFNWLVAACAVMVVAVIVLVSNDFANWAVVIALIAFNAPPVAVAIAITRYRLFDLERLISRTTAYAVVTGLLLATYAVLVAGATRLLPNANTLVVTAATLLVAALARPLYRRFKEIVDRRFNRARYDAHQTIDEFGYRLRSEIDTDTVRNDLVGIVHRALEPQDVVLWLKS